MENVFWDTISLTLVTLSVISLIAAIVPRS